jgi:hypothetical protein
MKTEDFEPQGFVSEARDGPIGDPSGTPEPDPPSGVNPLDRIILHINLWENAVEVVSGDGKYKGYNFKTLKISVRSYVASAGALLFRRYKGTEEGFPWNRIASYYAENMDCIDDECNHTECDEKWSVA